MINLTTMETVQAHVAENTAYGYRGTEDEGGMIGTD